MDFFNFLCFVKQHWVLIVLWSFLLVMVFYTAVLSWIRGRFEISCNEMVVLINKKNAVVIDIRSQNDYNSGYIINSINIPFDSGTDNIISLCKKFGSYPLVVVSGNNYSKSFSVKQCLNKLGFLEIYVLKEGIDSWKNHDFPLLSKK